MARKFSLAAALLATAFLLTTCKPDAPTNLTASATGRYSVFLEWTDNSTIEDGYNVSRSRDGVTFFHHETLPEDAATYIDEDADCDTEMFYRVQAFHDDDMSDPSNVASALTDPCPECYEKQIACGDDVTDDNASGDQRMGYYRCLDGYHGTYDSKEFIYEFTLAQDTIVSAVLTPAQGCRLSLFLLTECLEEDSCLVGGSKWIHRNLEAGTYYIVVEGYGGDTCGYDLTVGCEAPPVWTVETIETGEPYVYKADLSLDAADEPRIACIDGDLKYAAKGGAGWAVETVDAAGDITSTVTLALDDSDAAHIVYFDHNDLELRYAEYTSGAWETDVIVGLEYNTRASLVLDADGASHVSYYDSVFYKEPTGGKLGYATNASGAWTTQILDEAPNFNMGIMNAIARDDAGALHISYFYNCLWFGGLRHAEGAGGSWTIEEVDVGPEDEFPGTQNDIAIGPDGFPVISYVNLHSESGGWYWYALLLAESTAFYWSTTHVYDTEGYGGNTSLALSPDGSRYIAYRAGYSNPLRIATDAYEGWVHLVVDPDADSAVSPALVMDDAGDLHLTYTDGGTLRYATTRE